MKWISVKESLPAEEDEFLIWPHDKYAGATAMFCPYSGCEPYEKNAFYLESQYGEVSTLVGITHWMPLPSGP